MSIRHGFAVAGWLVRDTFKQAAATGLFWVMLTASAVCIAVCLSASVTGERKFVPDEHKNPYEFLPTTDKEANRAAADRYKGVKLLENRLTLGFGRMIVPVGRDADDSVRWLHYLLSSGVAESLGVLLALVWTAGFLPSFLQPNSVTVLLAKPAPRWLLLVGKYVGALSFVGVQASIFVLGTWTALGIRTGIWDCTYLWSVPLLLVQFAAYYGFSMLLAVYFRSTVVCVVGSILCWMTCLGVNIAYSAYLAEPHQRKQPSTVVVDSAAPNEEPKKPTFDPTKIPAPDERLKEKAKEKATEKASGKSEQTAAPKPAIEESHVSGPLAPGQAAVHPMMGMLLKTGYWILPKPADFGYVIFQRMKAGDFAGPPMYYEVLSRENLLDARWSIATSLMFAVFLVVASAQQFARTDY